MVWQCDRGWFGNVTMQYPYSNYFAPDADGRRRAWPMHRERFVGKGLPTDASPTRGCTVRSTQLSTSEAPRAAGLELFALLSAFSYEANIWRTRTREIGGEK